MSWKTILSCAACLLAGLLLGRLIPGTEPEMTVDSTLSATEHRPMRRASAGSAENRDGPRSARKTADALHEDNGTLANASGLHDPAADGPLVVVPASILTNLSSKRGTRSFAQDLFSKDGLEETGLQITDQEKARVQRAWRQVRTKVKKLEADASTSKTLPDGSVQITIPDLTETMGELGGDFKTDTENVLGGNRAGAFLAMKQIDSVFRRRKGAQSITIKMDAIGNGQWRYSIRRKSGGHTLSTMIGRSIPADLLHLTDKAGIQPKLQAPPEEAEE